MKKKIQLNFYLELEIHTEILERSWASFADASDNIVVLFLRLSSVRVCLCLFSWINELFMKISH